MSSVPPVGRLDGLADEVVTQARWWEGHLLEVLHGRRPDGPGGVPPRPEFDPTLPLSAREAAKAVELTAAGRPVSARAIRHRRQRYEKDGLLGLVDQRTLKPTRPLGRVDERVVEAMRAAIAEAADASTRTAGFVLWRTQQMLAVRPDAPGIVIPSRRTLYRLFDRLSAGRQVAGTARARRVLAARPAGVFTPVTAIAPGELMQIDSTPLDVLVRLDNGVAGRVELTALVDVATRSITAAVIRPSTKAVDAAVLLARSVTPTLMRPGWTQALSMSASALPHARLVDLDARLEHAAARPVIVPDTLVSDHGSVFISRAFRAACRFMGINLQPARKATPTDKPHVERTLGSVGSLFAQYLSGYVGRGVEHRGADVAGQALWSLPEIQELLDEWIVAVWQNRPHDGLRDPLAPGRAFTPNETYATLLESAGYTPLALSAQDYLELLPARWQTIGPAGIRIGRRTYDSIELDPLRGQPSGIAAKNNRWEIHHDPYDVSRVWVRDPDRGWLMVFWTHLHRAPTPFGELAWNHTRAALPEATEAELANATVALLARAHAGPADRQTGAPRLSARDRRVAATTKSTTASTVTAEVIKDEPPQCPGQPGEKQPDPQDTEGQMIVPLGLFDPFAEADNPW